MHATLRKLSGLTVLAALVCIPAHAQQQSSQSGSNDAVAEAAKKAREQKKEAPKPKKVYTDDDISSKKSDISIVGPAPATAEAATNTAKSTTIAPAADATDASKPFDANSEKAWRARFADLRTKIATAEQELDVLQREENKNSVQYYADPTKAMKEQYSREEINKKAAKIEAKKKEIANLKQQWSDAEDALRRAHGDPGWSRE